MEISKKDFTDLLEDRDGLRVSIYLPTHIGFARQQDTIRIKNLIRNAEIQLIRLGVSDTQIDQILEPALQFTDEFSFLHLPAGGLVMFLKRSTLRWFHFPLQFETLVVVAQRYHIKPLLPFVVSDGRFFVLALSQNEVRLIQCSSVGATEIPLKNIPSNLTERFSDVGSEKQLQFHTGTPGHPRLAAYHGHGIKDHAKDRITRFFQDVDRSVCESVGGDSAPMVLTGVDYLLPLYREVNTYKNLVDQGIPGNPENLGPDALRSCAWKIVEPIFTRGRWQAMERYRQLAETDRASRELASIVTAAHDGRIDTLFVTLWVQHWGTYDSNKRKVYLYGEERSGAEDILDLAVIQTLLNGGTVYAVKSEEIPGDNPAVALLRY